MGKSRQAEHQALIDWLLAQVEAHAVDAVLIAGDIFDTGAPPSYARELYSELVVKLQRLQTRIALLHEALRVASGPPTAVQVD